MVFPSFGNYEFVFGMPIYVRSNRNRKDKRMKSEDINMMQYNRVGLYEKEIKEIKWNVACLFLSVIGMLISILLIIFRIWGMD